MFCILQLYMSLLFHCVDVRVTGKNRDGVSICD